MASLPVLWHSTRYAAKPSDDPTKPADLLSTGTIKEVFETEHSTDAHFWTHCVLVNGAPYELQVGVPSRSGKPYGLGQNESVVSSMVVIEWDSLGHLPLTEETFSELCGSLSKLANTSFPEPTVFYTTRAGFRMVWQLNTPIPVELYKGHARGLLQALKDITGLEGDTSCDQWSRCYRLPKVKRDNVPSWESPTFALVIGKPVETKDLPFRVQENHWAVNNDSIAKTAPAPEKLRGLVTVEGPFYKAAKKLLKEEACYPYVFEGHNIPEGKRDSFLTIFAGKTVDKLYGKLDYLTVEHVYALLYLSVEHLATTGEDLGTKLWRLVAHAWACEAAKVRAKEEEAEEALGDREKFIAAHARVFGFLCPEDPIERERFVLKRLILTDSIKCFVAQARGGYAVVPLKDKQLPAYFRDELPWLHQMWTKNGTLKDSKYFLHNFSTNFQTVRYVSGKNRECRVELKEDGGLELSICPYELRKSILDNAQFDDEVDQWVQALGSPEILSQFFEHWPALDEGGIAALAIVGPKNTGKTMLGLALADLWGNSPCVGSAAFTQFNAGILLSPVVQVDEGLPVNAGKMAVADLFRSFVSGSGYAVEGKFGAITECRVPLRIILSSNNADILSELAGDRNLTRADSEALLQRLVLVTAKPEASELLTENGNRRWTEHSQNGPWIGGDPNKNGCRLARHIAWHYKTARMNGTPVPFTRFLVEGQVDNRTIAILEGKGDAPEIVAAICEDAKSLKSGLPGPMSRIRVEGSEVYIRKMEYVRHAVERLRSMTGRVSTQAVRRTLENWMSGAERIFPVKTLGNTVSDCIFSQVKSKEIIDIAAFNGIDASALIEVTSKGMVIHANR